MRVSTNFLHLVKNMRAQQASRFDQRRLEKQEHIFM